MNKLLFHSSLLLITYCRRQYWHARRDSFNQGVAGTLPGDQQSTGLLNLNGSSLSTLCPTYTSKPTRYSTGMARQEGLEPPTYCLEGSCSIQLSYWRISVERVTGIGPAYPAWKAGVLPLNYTRKSPDIVSSARGF